MITFLSKKDIFQDTLFMQFCVFKNYLISQQNNIFLLKKLCQQFSSCEKENKEWWEIVSMLLFYIEYKLY